MNVEARRGHTALKGSDKTCLSARVEGTDGIFEGGFDENRKEEECNKFIWVVVFQKAHKIRRNNEESFYNVSDKQVVFFLERNSLLLWV